MKFYIPFGDWSDDGHGQYKRILVEAPSMQGLLEAQKKIKEKYGVDFFDSIAQDYGDSSLGDQVYQALEDTNYPIQRWTKMADICEDTYKSWNELHLDDEKYIPLILIEDIFIWLLNAFGAEITIYDDDTGIPEINNWTCPGFETVGYGCFY